MHSSPTTTGNSTDLDVHAHQSGVDDTESTVEAATNHARWCIVNGFDELPDEALVSRAVAADILCVTVRTLYNWGSTAQKGPPVFRLSKGTPRYRVGDIRQYIAECAKR